MKHLFMYILSVCIERVNTSWTYSRQYWIKDHGHYIFQWTDVIQNDIALRTLSDVFNPDKDG